MDKDFFRKEVKEKRDRLSEEIREKESEIICKNIAELEIYKKSQKMLSFMNFGSELSIEILNKRIIEDGKILYLPRVEKDGNLSVVRYGKGFEIGSFGIREPLGEEYSGDLDLIIVPGLAFSRDGNRIGYGKGYYDRLFMRYSSTIKLAPIFDFQLYREIISEKHDEKMDIIVTKNEVLTIKKY